MPIIPLQRYDNPALHARADATTISNPDIIISLSVLAAFLIIILLMSVFMQWARLRYGFGMGSIGSSSEVDSSRGSDELKRFSKEVSTTAFGPWASKQTKVRPEIDFSTPICTICLEVLSAKCDIYDLPCQHVYHKPCLEKWIAGNHPSCPLCRKSVYRKSTGEIIADDTFASWRLELAAGVGSPFF
ncbi:hypothetical protein BX600DRAFT_475363 [Xylariales sp. PMI_506]|nr:hypothetical protein BX600DRAFT_475363 [Xylariales sp. PMI_506]